MKPKYTTGLMDGRDLRTTQEQKDNYSEVMSAITNKYFGKDVSDESFVGSAKMHRIFDNCTYGCLSISANGNVFACNQIHKLKSFGNIRTTSFDEIWRQSELAQAASHIKNLKPCNECPLMYICGGECRIKQFEEFCNCSDYSKLDVATVKPRHCDQDKKEAFFDLMIRTNKRIFQ